MAFGLFGRYIVSTGAMPGVQQMEKEWNMDDDLFEYSTTLNGGIVQVYIDLSAPAYMDRLDSVYFECTDVTSILDQNTLTALSMEAERAISGDLPDENLPRMGQFSR